MNAETHELNFVKIKQQSIEQTCKYADLEKTSQTLLTPDQSISQLINKFIERSAFKDVISVIAHALPPREAVYWACLCVRDVLDQNTMSEDLRAIKAAEQWVIKQSESDRMLNHQIAEDLDYTTASAWVSNAVFWSGGNISTDKNAKVEPPEGIFGKAISGAINLASATEDGKKTEQIKKQFIKRGINIAQGGKGDI